MAPISKNIMLSSVKVARRNDPEITNTYINIDFIHTYQPDDGISKQHYHADTDTAERIFYPKNIFKLNQNKRNQVNKYKRRDHDPQRRKKRAPKNVRFYNRCKWRHSRRSHPA